MVDSTHIRHMKVNFIDNDTECVGPRSKYLYNNLRRVTLQMQITNKSAYANIERDTQSAPMAQWE